MIRLVKRLAGLDESVTALITARAAEMRAQSRDIIGFSAGESDFDTPANIKDAAILCGKFYRTRPVFMQFA